MGSFDVPFGVLAFDETLANLTPLPQAAIDAVRASLAGKALVVAGEGLEVTGSLPHGHVAAVHVAGLTWPQPNRLPEQAVVVQLNGIATRSVATRGLTSCCTDTTRYSSCFRLLWFRYVSQAMATVTNATATLNQVSRFATSLHLIQPAPWLAF
jgi:hypothetical protein